ncbi:MAG: NF038122 family metalloprotease [Caulobacteraceae bacterium]
MPPSTETVTSPGSGLVFVNTYTSAVSGAYRNAVIAAETFYQAHFTNAVTINVNFDFKPLSDQFSAYNTYPIVQVSYDQLRAALQAHAATINQVLAANGLPAADPSNGQGFSLADGEAQILGLAGPSGQIDDNIVLNSNLSWTFGQDAIGEIEHELSEGGLGRFGGLGVQYGLWGAMDLFRFTATGQRDYTGGRDGVLTYYGLDAAHVNRAFQFHNSINAGGVFDGFDLADWNATVGDAFGPGGPGSPGTVSATDLQVLEGLGWTPTGAAKVPTRADITQLYETYFGRLPHPAELTVWEGQVAKGATYQTIRAALVAAPEGQAHTTADITALYETYFGRAPQASELNVGRSAIAGGDDFNYLRSVLVHAPEGVTYAQSQIAPLYETYLGRAAPPSAIAAWDKAFQNGVSLDVLVAALLFSPASKVTTLTAPPGHAPKTFQDFGGPLKIDIFAPTDRLIFVGSAFTGFVALDHAVQVREPNGQTDVLITAPNENAAVLLQDVQLSALSAANFTDASGSAGALAAPTLQRFAAAMASLGPAPMTAGSLLSVSLPRLKPLLACSQA